MSFGFDDLVIATHNRGKLAEFRAMLAGCVSNVTSAGELGLPEPEETGTTFVENALLKARAAAMAAGKPALADDSGLCVHALGDAPGLLSGRYAEVNGRRDFAYGMQRLHDELGDSADRSAHFISVLALVWPDGRHKVFEGRVDGVLVWPPRGTHGHGYDPLFLPDGFSETFAELSDEAKNAISHRARAVEKLRLFLAQSSI